MTDVDTKFGVDLTNCDREPIHIPGAIQPHGCLLAYSASDLKLIGYSSNAEQWLKRTPQWGEPAGNLFSTEFANELERIRKSSPGIVHHLNGSSLDGKGNSAGQFVSAAAHYYDDRILVELETPHEIMTHSRVLGNLPLRLNLVNRRLQACQDSESLYATIAEEVREVSGYDRVMVYQFEEDQHGHVVGESVDGRFGSFLGMHFPASDIPQPARRLYVLNTVRSIADVDSIPVDIIRDTSADSRPLDLSHSCFRAVSPIHIEYLKNMGVQASMSISILDGGKLWGLIACHHYQSKTLSFEERAACEILGLTAATYLTAREREHHNKLLAHKQFQHAKLLRKLAEADHFSIALSESNTALCELVNADGVAICWRGSLDLFGKTTEKSMAEKLAARYLHNQIDIAASHSIADDALEGSKNLGFSRGFLAIPLSAPDLQGLIFFRGEYVHEVSWAGKPNKPMEVEGMGVRLSPRLSFEKWTETVVNQSRRWSPIDLAIADDIRSGMVELLARRASQLEIVNAELRRLNDDLDSFAYAASHDLREPLRGLNLNMHMLNEDLAEFAELPAVSKRTQAMNRLCDRMDDLINGLLRLSRAGRRDLEIEPLNVQSVLEVAIQNSWENGQPNDLTIASEIEVDVLLADYACLIELLTNLLTNAYKYNANAFKSVVVRSHKNTSRRTPNGERPTILEVQDNGIGIPSDQIARAFEMFRRLGNPEAYADGIGAGLAIVKKIVQRHGGEVWVRPNPAGGTIFVFTLEPSQ